MNLPVYHVHAFSGKVFGGNPAAVCPCTDRLPDAVLQAIATENNLSETAFVQVDSWPAAPVDRSETHAPEIPSFQPTNIPVFSLRWFTPKLEVDLCGHATLATAHVLFRHLPGLGSEIGFDTRSGRLRVRREGDRYVLDLPVQFSEPCTPPHALVQGLGLSPVACLRGMDYLAVFDDASAIESLKPDFDRLSELDRRGVIVTAPGRGVDFVSRFFAPNCGIQEDPVTGSAHCALTPYWVARLNKNPLQAHQLSARGGRLECRLCGDRVELRGEAALYLEGTLHL